MRGKTELADVITNHHNSIISDNSKNNNNKISNGQSKSDSNKATVPNINQLPSTLIQTEIKVTFDDKDAILYNFLIKTNSRTLVFVNSIKSARRVDGLLRVLGVNSRAVHADLQQRQVRAASIIVYLCIVTSISYSAFLLLLFLLLLLIIIIIIIIIGDVGYYYYHYYHYHNNIIFIIINPFFLASACD